MKLITAISYNCSAHISPTAHNTINHLHSEDKCPGQVNQSVRYVHSCLWLAILIRMSTNNPSVKSMVLESSVKLSLDKLAKK